MTIAWRQHEGSETWSARVVPNPMGMEIEAEPAGDGCAEPLGPFEWRVYATTEEEVCLIHMGGADTLDDAKRLAEGHALQVLLEHQYQLKRAIESFYQPN